MKRPFRRWTTGLTGPLAAGVEIVLSDDSDLPVATRPLYVGGAGDIQGHIHVR